MKTQRSTHYPLFILLIACVVFSLALAACRPVNVTINLPPAATQIPATTAQVPSTAQPTPPPATTSGDLILDLTGVAQGQTVETIAAVQPSADGPYWNAVPEYQSMTLQGYPVTGHLTQPQIFIYPAADFIGINETAVRTITDLQNLLQARQPVERMPFLPLTSESQAMHAQVQYLNFQDGKSERLSRLFDKDRRLAGTTACRQLHARSDEAGCADSIYRSEISTTQLDVTFSTSPRHTSQNE